jgi:endonuclease IV
MKLGVHVTKSSKVLDDKTQANNLSSALVRDQEALNINAAQIFTYGPRFMNKNNIDYKAVKKITKRHNIDLSVHSAYMTVGIWKITDQNKNTDSSKKALNNLEKQVKSCREINAWGLVVHITKQRPEQVSSVVKLIKPIFKKYKVKLLLEMVSSKADDKTYETPEKINYLTELIGHKPVWWGWCIDTAHLWGAGESAVQKYDSMKKWLKKLKHKNKVKMIHLNGSSSAKGSGKDKHEIAFSTDDIIWNKVSPEKSGLRAVIEFAKKRNITVICEINRGKEKDVRNSLKKINNLSN